MRAAAVLAALALVAPVAARAQEVPPPTPVPPFGSPSPFPTALETPAPSATPPEPDAASVVLVDLDSGQVLHEQAARRRRPVASTTKIMTALVVLESTRPVDMVTVSRTAASQTGAVLGLEPGERIRVRDLLYAIMLQSANDAAVALAEHVAGSVEAFVDAMNRRSRQLGLRDTAFASPTGLDDAGLSTARDMAAITVEALGQPLVARATATRFHRIRAPEGPPRTIQNRNALLWLYEGAAGVKTGFTTAAGFCIVAAAERDDLRLAAVVLGGQHEVFSDAAALLDHGFEAFERRTVVGEGEAVEPITVEGRPVPAAAGASLTLLVRRGDAVQRSVVPVEGLSLPVMVGDRVGTLVVRGDGDRRLGRVPLVAGRGVAALPAPEEEGPWWVRTWEAILEMVGGLLRSLA